MLANLNYYELISFYEISKVNILKTMTVLTGFHTGGGRGCTCPPPCSFKCPPRKPLTQRMKRCDLVPAPFKNLHIPDFPPCMQILYETLINLTTFKYNWNLTFLTDKLIFLETFVSWFFRIISIIPNSVFRYTNNVSFYWLFVVEINYK